MSLDSRIRSSTGRVCIKLLTKLPPCARPLPKASISSSPCGSRGSERMWRSIELHLPIFTPKVGHQIAPIRREMIFSSRI
jgi:hypothetical protein